MKIVIPIKFIESNKTDIIIKRDFRLNFCPATRIKYNGKVFNKKNRIVLN